MNIRAIFVAAALVAGPVTLAAPVAMAEAPIYTGWLSDEAVQGYDAVAYFTEGEPREGRKEFQTAYMGANFLFATAENRDLFIADPERYAPQYGGYCAWAVAEGKHAKGSAKHWSIVDNKLYLNYNSSVQDKWDADRAGFITKADKEWPELNQ